MAGADEISVEFTPPRIAKGYNLYEESKSRYVVTPEKLTLIQNELK